MQQAASDAESLTLLDLTIAAKDTLSTQRYHPLTRDLLRAYPQDTFIFQNETRYRLVADHGEGER